MDVARPFAWPPVALIAIVLGSTIQGALLVIQALTGIPIELNDPQLHPAIIGIAGSLTFIGGAVTLWSFLPRREVYRTWTLEHSGLLTLAVGMFALAFFYVSDLRLEGLTASILPGSIALGVAMRARVIKRYARTVRAVDAVNKATLATAITEAIEEDEGRA